MEAAHKEECTYNSKKILIVRLPNTIIQPSAMMIEPIHTSVALTTMLRWVLHMRFTNFTIILKVTVIEINPIKLLLNSFITPFFQLHAVNILSDLLGHS